jgi:uncharacterized RDD family membrane protein YckC
MASQIPAGWYTDPAPAQPGAPPQHRYWDGQQWTEHVQAAPDPGSYPGPYPGAYAGGPVLATTPDGQRLAGWWQRVAAYLLDSVVVFAVSAVAGWPFMSRIVSAYRDFIYRAMRAAENGTATPGQADLIGEIFLPLLGFVAVSLLVSLVYNASFLKALAATPGKLVMGLRVRLRERPGPLSWGTVLVRWLTQNIASFFSVVPLVGSLAGLYPLLDSLWPLWDAKKQALHDKAARTNVVRVRG